MTDSELAWLSQITKLRQSIQKAISPSANTNLTVAELARWESAMRGCRRTLVRIGPASARLRPVEALVEQGCQAYDKGAACFAAAAPLLSSSSRVREAQRALDCGSSAVEKGATLLGEAEIKGVEIKLSS
jgi:hypothetical protein